MRPRLTCFSYLAAAQLLRVEYFPQVNYGAEVRDMQQAVAADGVIVATACSRLGVEARLACNPVGTDNLGLYLAEVLRLQEVHCNVVAGVSTPLIIVVTDAKGNRAWLPFLPNVVAHLVQLDLTLVDEASMIYLDCYELLAEPAMRVIRHGAQKQARLFVNLGGSAIPEELTAEPLPAGSVEVVQTNVAEPEFGSAEALGQSLRAAFGARFAVVTAGAKGAVALSDVGLTNAPAYEVEVRHTHGAGAAVSAVMACGLLQGWDLREILPLACAAGSWRCEAGPADKWLSLAELEDFAAQRPVSS